MPKSEISFFNPISHNLDRLEEQAIDIQTTAQIYGNQKPTESSAAAQNDTATEIAAATEQEKSDLAQINSILEKNVDAISRLNSSATNPLFEKLEKSVADLIRFYEQLSHVYSNFDKNQDTIKNLKATIPIKKK